MRVTRTAGDIKEALWECRTACRPSESAREAYSGPHHVGFAEEVSAMFGTVARMKFKPGSFEKMQDVMKGFEEQQVKGFVFNAVYRSKSDPEEVWLIVGFEDE